MALTFVIVCEARNDFLTASELVDRVVCGSVEWIEPEFLDSLRDYSIPTGDEPFLTWKRVKGLAKESRLLPRGLIDGRPGDLDAQQTRRALYYIESNWPKVDGILLIRDDDRLVERRSGLEQARAASSLRERIVIGLAHTKRECWVLAGFEPIDEKEQELLVELRRELGFDPCIKAEELTAIHDHDKRSAKRVETSGPGRPPPRGRVLETGSPATPPGPGRTDGTPSIPRGNPRSARTSFRSISSPLKDAFDASVKLNCSFSRVALWDARWHADRCDDPSGSACALMLSVIQNYQISETPA